MGFSLSGNELKCFYNKYTEPFWFIKIIVMKIILPLYIIWIDECLSKYKIIASQVRVTELKYQLQFFLVGKNMNMQKINSDLV